MLPKYGSIPQHFFEFSDSLREWNASFKSRTDNTSPLEHDKVLWVPPSNILTIASSDISYIKGAFTFINFVPWVSRSCDPLEKWAKIYLKI